MVNRFSLFFIEMSAGVAAAAIAGVEPANHAINIVTDAEGNMMYEDPVKVKEVLESRKKIVGLPPATTTVAPKPVVAPKPAPAPKPKMKTGSVRTALSSNLTKRIKGMPSDIVVMNERVQLQGTSLLGTNVDFSSDDSYFPLSKNTPNDIIEGKLVFAKVFGPNSGFTLENPSPPCDINEYSTLRQGLQNRLEGIRRLIKVGEKAEGDTIRVRALTEQGIMIKKLLDGMDEEGNPCSDYTNKEKYGFSKLSNLNDDQIHRLIRNFSFLVLQALNPVSGYDDKMLVDPIDLINVLDNPDLTTGDMNRFLEEYQAQYKIPTLIASILSDTDTQKSFLHSMLEDEKRRLLDQIIYSLQTKLSPELKTDFDKLKPTLVGTELLEQITAILGWLVTKLNDTLSSKSEVDKKIEALELEKRSLTEELAKVTSEKDLSAAVAASAAAGVATSAAASAAASTAADLVKGQLSAELTSAQAKLRSVQAELEVCKGELALYKSNHATLTSSLDEVNNKLSQNNRKITEIARAIENGTSSELGDDYGEFNDLLRVINEKVGRGSSSLTDFCYLNYFVGFFFKEFPQESSEKLALIQKVEPLTSAKIEEYLNEIFKVLESGNATSANGELASFVNGGPDTTQISSIIKNKFIQFFNKHKTNIKYFVYFLFIARKYILDNPNNICKPNNFLTESEPSALASSSTPRGRLVRVARRPQVPRPPRSPRAPRAPPATVSAVVAPAVAEAPAVVAEEEPVVAPEAPVVAPEAVPEAPEAPEAVAPEAVAEAPEAVPEAPEAVVPEAPEAPAPETVASTPQARAVPGYLRPTSASETRRRATQANKNARSVTLRTKRPLVTSPYAQPAGPPGRSRIGR